MTGLKTEVVEETEARLKSAASTWRLSATVQRRVEDGGG